jgi:predicted RNA-binding Zn-ribbon protein involved in translation (DUF1610 family)
MHTLALDAFGQLQPAPWQIACATLVSVGILAVLITLLGLRTRCPNCGSLFALRQIDPYFFYTRSQRRSLRGKRSHQRCRKCGADFHCDSWR